MNELSTNENPVEIGSVFKAAGMHKRTKKHALHPKHVILAVSVVG
jgi:hypothetical protein